MVEAEEGDDLGDGFGYSGRDADVVAFEVFGRVGGFGL